MCSLSDQKKTHKSRGFGFVEFALPQVAKAAAEAMHNYLFFNQVLKCRQMDKNDLPKHLFKTKYSGPTTVEVNKENHNVEKERYEENAQTCKENSRDSTFSSKVRHKL
ncbi:hypothetical protein SUGI_1515950 [Cryptomeria japonica]|uniref:RRM domain-containing protein n=1 Tax=Cryptomeria japonica TaxID=3369 RepID=A0AAD3RSA1_CRYJA|nr:hypothetical protein SUGI_1515950 [Cryptomeria japonica]